MAIVDTMYGKLEGFVKAGAHVFKDVPYARAPIGDRRWLAPEPPESWRGVRTATEWNRQAWQQAAPGEGPLKFVFNASNTGKRTEDCLVLNVFTPGLDDTQRPVLVWIHGGGFGGGTGCTPTYDGTTMAVRGDVVVVTINYRVGVLGFLNLNEITGGRIPARGNEGLLDQTMALKWVRDNIGAFGGDPGNVTIYGESAGGMSVGALMAFEPARGLFHRASPISGSTSTANSLDRAVDISDRLMSALGLSPKNDIDKLLALHPEALMKACQEVRPVGGGMIFAPVVDGTQLPDVPLEAVKNGSADGISVLVGTTRDEWRLFIVQNPATEDEDALIAELGKHVDDATALFDGYRQIRSKAGTDADPISLYAAIESARKMWLPANALAQALSERGQGAYQYLFTSPSPYIMENGKPLALSHAVVIGYLFGTYNMSEESAAFFGEGEAADTLAGHVMDSWINFARTGNPQTEALADWVPYDAQTRTTAVLGHPAEIINAPFEEERALWDGISQTALPFGPARDV